MTIIFIAVILIFIISIIWIWHNLGNIEKPRKIAFIIVGLLVTYLITLLIYKFANSNIVYPNIQVEKSVYNILMMVFTGLNSLILLPFIANLFDNILEEKIDKDQVKKRLIIILVIFVACVFIEKGYLKDTQKGIINIYNEVQNAEK